MRPDFQQEYIEIEKQVYVQLLTYTCKQQDIVQKVEQIQFSLGEQAKVIISLQLKMPIDYSLPRRLYQLQEDVQQSFYQHFGYELDGINVQVHSVVQKRK